MIDPTVLITQLQPSLVVVQGNRRGAGAGVIWNKEGLIVTNNHVVTSQHLTITLSDDRQVPGRILHTEPQFDLALLKIDR